MSTIIDTLQAGLDHHRAGRLREAQTIYCRVVEMHPRHARAMHLLGLVEYQLGQHEAAIEHLCAATHCDRFNAEFQADLGEIYRALSRLPEAMAACAEALRLDPTLPAVHNCLGMCHEARGDLVEAEQCFRHAARRSPRDAAAHSNLGRILRAEGLLSEAQAAMETAMRLAPDSALHCLNLGVCLADQGMLQEALAWYEKAIQLRPDWVDARCNLGMARLALGDFAGGWPGFESRLNPHRYPLPLWNGAPLQAGRLFVSTEQGLGDTLQFVRYLPLVEQRGAPMFVDVHEDLVSLLAQSGYKNLVSDAVPPAECTCQISIMSLPRVMGTTLESIPTTVPYLSAPDDLVDKWRAKLAAQQGLRVGIHWQGNRGYGHDQRRSIPLGHFAPLAAIEGVRLVSLQKNAGREQLAEVAGPWPIIDLADDLVDFLETAAVMRNLDLVISCDSAPAHLAGGLGVPVWVALPVACDWRWMQNRTDSPWYPTMRLFRQNTPGAWEHVLAEIAAALAPLAANGTTHDP